MAKNSKYLIAAIVLLVVIVGVYLLYYKKSPSYSNTSQMNNMNENNNSTGGTTAPTSPNAVNIQSNAYSPDSLTVKVGTTVTWTNNDGYAHTVTDRNGGFDSDNLDAGKAFSFTFNTEGTFNYYCVYHPYMTGKIIVTK